MLKRLFVALLALFAAAAFAAVEVNTATPQELDSVKGIGPATATKIVEARKTQTFKDWNDLINRVKGIGKGSAAKLSAGGLTVNGAAFDGAKPAAKATAAAPAAAPVAATAAPAKPAAVAPVAPPAPTPAAQATTAAKSAVQDKVDAAKATGAAAVAVPANPLKNPLK